MSRAIVTEADFDNNVYAISIPGFGESLKAQGITKDEIAVGTIVEVVDINNQPPDKAIDLGPLRIAPNDGEYIYDPTKVWKFPEEFLTANAQASLMKAFFFSSEENPLWQVECPLYRSGTVTEIIDETYMNVSVDTITSDFTPIFKCETDYMACNTAAFAVDDKVTVMFVNQCLLKPKVIGFWEDPKWCTPFLYVKIERRYSHQDLMLKELSFVWDIQKNDYASLKDQDDKDIEFPCRDSVLSYFISNSEDVGDDLFVMKDKGLRSTIYGLGLYNFSWYLSPEASLLPTGIAPPAATGQASVLNGYYVPCWFVNSFSIVVAVNVGDIFSDSCDSNLIESELDSDVFDEDGETTLKNVSSSVHTLDYFNTKIQFPAVPSKYVYCMDKYSDCSFDWSVYGGVREWLGPAYERLYNPYGFFGSINLFVQNESAVKTSVRNYIWKQYGWEHTENFAQTDNNIDPPSCDCSNDLDTDYWKGEDDLVNSYSKHIVTFEQQSGHDVITPLGTFCNLVLPGSREYYVEQYETGGLVTASFIKELSWTEEQFHCCGFYGGRIETSGGVYIPEIDRIRYVHGRGKGIVKGLYTESVMSQIYLHQWMGISINMDEVGDDIQIPPISTWDKDDRVVDVLASASLCEGDTLDPKLQARNSELETAILDLLEEWYSLNKAPDWFCAAGNLEVKLLQGSLDTSISSSSSCSSCSSSSCSSSSSVSSSSSCSSSLSSSSSSFSSSSSLSAAIISSSSSSCSSSSCSSSSSNGGG